MIEIGTDVLYTVLKATVKAIKKEDPRRVFWIIGYSKK